MESGECMGVASGCGEQEVGVASGSNSSFSSSFFSRPSPIVSYLLTLVYI